MPVRHLVWDMDGTLLDSGVAVPVSFVAAVRRLGGPQLRPEDVAASYARGPSDVLLAHLLGRDLAAGESEVYYEELSGATVLPYPGVLDVLVAPCGQAVSRSRCSLAPAIAPRPCCWPAPESARTCSSAGMR